MTRHNRSRRRLTGGWPLLLLLAGLATAQAIAAQATAPVVVVIETEKGIIEVALDAARAPGTVANFLKYVDGGLYDGGRFHRTVRPETETNRVNPIQVIQGGRQPDPARPGFPAVPLERTRDTGLLHKDGVISMARGGADTARSDFFICVGDQPSLDFGGARNADGQGFAAFGRVVRGMEVVRAIQESAVRPGTQTLEPPIRILRTSRK